MNLFLLSTLALILLSTANSQLVTTYVLDWQNSANILTSYCAPKQFAVAFDSSNNPVNVTYTYATPQTNCPSNISDYTFSKLNAGATPSTYTDTFGDQLVYSSSDGGFFQFTNPTISLPILYSPSGGVLNIQDVYYPLFGSWHNPQPLNASDQSVCCVPNGIFVSETEQQIPGMIQVVMMSYDNNCSINLNHILNVWNSQVTTVNFGDNQTNSTIDLSFFPAGTNGVDSQFNITLNYTTKTCRFSYEKIATTQLLQNTWLLDWQTPAIVIAPQSYQISEVNSTYMRSNFTESDKSDEGYVSQNLQGQYYDSNLGLAFNYDNITQSLLDTAIPNGILYSLTGSLFSFDAFVKNWSNPQTTADNSSCCIPNYIQLTQNPSVSNQLNAVLYYPTGYNETEGCDDFVTDIIDGTYHNTFTVATPSVTQVIWSDYSGLRFFFANSSDPSEIVISIPSQCNVSMTVTNDQPPQPQPQPPLSAIWLSSKVICLVMGLFILANYI